MSARSKPGAGRRRPAGSDTRAAILRAARACFAERGYERSTIRAIAAEADVDPALVLHYFSSKDRLFVAALELPVEPESVLRMAAAEGPHNLGAAVVRTFFETWDAPENREHLVAMMRSAMTNETAMSMVREYLERRVFGPVSAAVGGPDAGLRATLVGSQLMGLAMMRYVARIEPLASTPADQLAAFVGPTIQRYLTAEPELA